MPLPDREQARRILERALGACGGAEARADLTASVSALTRFGAGAITQNSVRENAVLAIEVALDAKAGSSSTNRLDDAGVRACAEDALAAARLAPPDPEHMPVLGSETYADIQAFVERTAAATPQDRARGVETAIRICRGSKSVGAGTFSTDASVQAIATSAGLFAFHPSTEADFTLTARTNDGTGAAKVDAGGVRDVARIDPEALARAASERANRSRDPKPVEPGDWTVLLEPMAAREFVLLLATSLDARDAEEGRSFFSVHDDPDRRSRLGERVVGENVTFRTDPARPDLLGSPFDGEGMPVRPTPWIEKGVLRNLSVTRFWGKKTGREPTPAPRSLVLDGEDRSRDELLRLADRALLIPNFWYIRSVDPMRALFTGLTRDGVFLVEKGEIVHPVKNLRFNESPAVLLSNVRAFSRPEKLGASLLPGILAGAFTFTAVSDAV
ncbi:MAG TPA: TldD/PmbA family protein [Planctomycetota bacterium]|jgi:predicted Zn-dependent protease|nr:TldD/PmbA family protein [Planctomycetota bacterium]